MLKSRCLLLRNSPIKWFFCDTSGRSKFGADAVIRTSWLSRLNAVGSRAGSAAMAAKTRVKSVPKSSLVNCHLQVLGTGSSEVSPCLFLFTDSRRYLFNCGENFQRVLFEHRVRMSKLQNLFITRASWRNLGGLLGFSMYLRVGLGGNHSLKLHGPEGLGDFVRASTIILGREQVELELPQSGSAVYTDENITITTLELEAENSDPLSSDSEPDEVAACEPAPKKVKTDLPDPHRSNSIAAFVCKLTDVPGKFNAQRAKELGLCEGLSYKKLVNGESVTTPAGRVIRPCDVIGPKQNGPSFIVLECPNLTFVPAITTHPVLRNDAFASSEQSLSLVVHIAPEEVLQNDEYSKWMASFGSETKHLLLGKGVCPVEVSLQSMLKLQTPLHLMNPAVHLLPTTEEQGANGLNQTLKVSKLLPKESVILGQVLMKYHLKPVHKTGVDNSDALKTVRKTLDEELLKIQSNARLSNAVLNPGAALSGSSSTIADGDYTTEPRVEDGKDQWVDISQIETSSQLEAASESQVPLSTLVSRLHRVPDKPLRPDDAIVSFPGTGASCPSKYRNVSGILIQTPSSGNLILDCGEGTLSQIYKSFGQEKGDDIIRNLRAVFISHIHGDHQLGTLSVLQRRAELLSQKAVSEATERERRPEGKTVVIGSPLYRQWLHKYTTMCERAPYKYIYADDLLKEDLPPSVRDIFRNQLADFSIQTVPVIHCKKAYGVVVQHRTGWKVVYSGDTRPCPELAEVGRNATLLIHEATFEDDLQTDAETKKHCTISEALEIARQMNPDFTILTHFSQRYPMVSPALLNGDTLKAKVGMAFDCMSVRLSEVHTLPTFLPAMKEIFAVVTGVEDTTEPAVSWSWL